MREFELLGVGEEAPSPQLLATLHDCCLVIDALGFKVLLLLLHLTAAGMRGQAVCSSGKDFSMCMHALTLQAVDGLSQVGTGNQHSSVALQSQRHATFDS